MFRINRKHTARLSLVGLWFTTFLLLSVACQAAEPAWQGVWSGTIGKARITACLSQDGPSKYHYQRYRKDIPLTRHGGQWQEMVNGTVTGIWTLNNPQSDALDGTWRNPATGRSLAIQLSRDAGADYAAPCESLVYLSKGMIGKPVDSMKETATTHAKGPGKGAVANYNEARGRTSGFVTVSGGAFPSVRMTRDGKALMAVRSDIPSIDGGTRRYKEGSRVDNDLYMVIVEPRGALVAVGHRGTIERSTDGGISWSLVSAPMIERSPNYGIELTVVKSGTINDLYSILNTPGGSLLAFGNWDTILRSTDGGASWSVVENSTECDRYLVCTTVDGTLAWPNDGVSCTNDSAILCSTDGDDGWSPVNRDDKDSFNSITVAPNGALVAVGDGGAIIHSTDRGASWSVVKEGSADKPLNSVITASSGVLVAVGDGGSIVRSVDSGVSWSKVDSGTKNQLSSVIVVPNGVLVAVGDEGSIVRSIDGGVRWSVAKSSTKNHLLSIIAVSDGALVAVGYEGTVIRSTDNGATWTVLDSDTNRTLTSVVSESDGTIVAVGFGGVIIRGGPFSGK